VKYIRCLLDFYFAIEPFIICEYHTLVLHQYYDLRY
jgi:hypothetical protein